MTIRSKWYNEIPAEIRDIIWRVKAKLPGVAESYEHDFQQDIDADYDQLEVQLEEIPSVFAYTSSMLAEAKTMVSIKKLAVKRARAKIVQEILEDSRQKQRTPPRKTDIDDLIEGDEKVVKLTAELIQAERTESKLIGFVQAIKMKHEALRTLAGFKKQELSDS